MSACLKTGPDVIQKEVKENLQDAGKAATDALNETNKKAASIGDLFLKSKDGVSKMDDEVKDFQKKLRKKGEGVSEAKKLLNEKCIEECSTGMSLQSAYTKQSRLLHDFETSLFSNMVVCKSLCDWNY